MAKRSQDARNGENRSRPGSLDSRHKSRLVYSVKPRPGRTIYLPGVRVQLPSGEVEKPVSKPVLKVGKALKQMGTKVEIKSLTLQGPINLDIHITSSFKIYNFKWSQVI